MSKNIQEATEINNTKTNSVEENTSNTNTQSTRNHLINLAIENPRRFFVASCAAATAVTITPVLALTLGVTPDLLDLLFLSAAGAAAGGTTATLLSSAEKFISKPASNTNEEPLSKIGKRSRSQSVEQLYENQPDAKKQCIEPNEEKSLEIGKQSCEKSTEENLETALIDKKDEIVDAALKQSAPITITTKNNDTTEPKKDDTLVTPKRRARKK